METDKHYFFEGLFIIGLFLAAALFAVWLGRPGSSDDVVYHIHFPDSVSGLSVGEPVKYRGVNVGSVKEILIEPDTSKVRVDVRLRKGTPVKTDTRAGLELKGITGNVFIELSGGNPAAQTLLASTPAGQTPEIPFEKTGLKAMIDDLPKLAAKFSALADKFGGIGDQVKKVVKGVGALTDKVTDNPSLLLRAPKKKEENAPVPPSFGRH